MKSLFAFFRFVCSAALQGGIFHSQGNANLPIGRRLSSPAAAKPSSASAPTPTDPALFKPVIPNPVAPFADGGEGSALASTLYLLATSPTKI